MTLYDVYEEIAETLALAQTRALMGEQEVALALFREAGAQFLEFREVLAAMPGFHALAHALENTQVALDITERKGAVMPERTRRTGARRKARRPV
ncbi:MAG: hypothetical protein RMJ43_02760 [Chloroherpetonaceae bacterium]|nr:hypothetical protein [Chthonomonadaceae bacterium]MDW8206729.1 hypothetical protein [Chloroherpetonaceae bacterium]